MLLKQWLHVTQTSRHILTCKSPNPYRVINTLSEVMVFYSTFSHTIQLSKARESCSINHQSQIGFFKGMSSPSPPHPVTNSNITKTGSNIHTHFRQHTTHAHIMQTETDRVFSVTIKNMWHQTAHTHKLTGQTLSSLCPLLKLSRESAAVVTVES